MGFYVTILNKRETVELSLRIKNFVKEFLLKGGIRCEILNSGKIAVGDIIKIKKWFNILLHHSDGFLS